ncbi:hypothetical protein HDU96_009688 [Phlyctochytrium bullatum]|nr:hypothetical protein HDU96_009688 [Phlyctochytrium bullatum]
MTNDVTAPIHEDDGMAVLRTCCFLLTVAVILALKMDDALVETERRMGMNDDVGNKVKGGGFQKTNGDEMEGDVERDPSAVHILYAYSLVGSYPGPRKSPLHHYKVPDPINVVGHTPED